MVEERFPASGLSAEYGDIVIGSVASAVIVEFRFNGNLVHSEMYSPDADSKIYIREFGELAMSFFLKFDFMTVNGDSGSGIVALSISIIGTTTITKEVTIYPSIVDFSGTLDVDLLKLIPLSRSTNKTTAVGRKEFISFYGNCTLTAYVVKRGTTQDEAVTVTVASYTLATKIFNTDVSPAVIAALASCDEADLIYYNIYKSTDSIIRFTMDERNYPNQKTFVFRNCFGAQETFTCVGDESSDRKWKREFGTINNKQTSISRDLENKFSVSAGFISDEDVEVLEDLLNSDQICLLDEYGYQDIVITEENFSNTDRQDELKTVGFTYRFAQNNQFKTSYKAFKKPRIFTTEFDETFN